MRIIIAGATRLGATLARRLVDTDAAVVLIDKDRAALDAIADDLDCGLIHADATLPSTLREAAQDDPDVLVALTHSDEDNILCAVVGRSVGFKRVIPQISSIELTSICEELDLTDFTTPDETIATSLITAIEDGSSPMQSTPLCGDLTQAAYEITGNLAGTAPADLDLPEGAQAIAVTRGGQDHFIVEVDVFREGDGLVLLLQRECLRQVVADLARKDQIERKD